MTLFVVTFDGWTRDAYGTQIFLLGVYDSLDKVTIALDSLPEKNKEQ